MSPRPSAPPQLLIHEIAQGASVEGFRIVNVPDPADPALVHCFRSHYEADMEPRYEETQHAALHMAISMWRTRDQATRIARAFPKIGGHVAHVRLEAGHGFNYLDPAAERNIEHLTVWGHPERLAAAVVDIVAV